MGSAPVLLLTLLLEIASASTTIQKEGTEFVAYASTPQEALDLRLRLLLWSSKVGEAPELPSITKDRNGRHVFRATDLIPPFVRETYGLKSAVNGPNCFGTALGALGYADAMRGAGGMEIEAFRESPACAELPIDEQNASDDPLLGLVTDPPFDAESHAFIDLGNDLCFSKNGMTTASAPLFQSCRKMLQSYVSDTCLANPEGESCSRVKVFRCDGKAELAKKAPPASPRFASCQALLGSVESTLAGLVYDHQGVTNGIFPKDTLDALMKTVDVISSEFHAEFEDLVNSDIPQLAKEQEFQVLLAESSRAYSVMEQLFDYLYGIDRWGAMKRVASSEERESLSEQRNSVGSHYYAIRFGHKKLTEPR